MNEAMNAKKGMIERVLNDNYQQWPMENMMQYYNVQGGWENDETVEEAALREAVEEAGVRGELMHFLGHYPFKSKTLQDEFSPEGLCKAAMFALLVKEELQSWPEQRTRQRSWLTVSEAAKSCRHEWMKQVLQESFSKWEAEYMSSTSNEDAG